MGFLEGLRAIYWTVQASRSLYGIAKDARGGRAVLAKQMAENLRKARTNGETADIEHAFSNVELLTKED